MSLAAQPRTPPLAFWVAVLLGSAPLGVFEFVLPLYGQAVGASPTAIGALFSIFSLTAILVRLVLQWGLDRWPRRWVFAGGLVWYIVSMLVFAGARDVGDLALARLIQGVASTATWLTAAVLLAAWSASEQRGAAFGRLQIVATWGAGLGATWTLGAIGALDAQARAEVGRQLAAFGLGPLSWPWPALPALPVLRLVFAGYALASALALLAALCLPPEPKPVAEARTALRLANNQLRRSGWLGSTLRTLIGLPPGRSLLLVSLLRGGALGLTLPVLILYLEDRFAAERIGALLAASIPGVVYAIAPQPLGRLADRVGYQRSAVSATLLSGATFLVLPLMPGLLPLALLWVVEALSFSLAAPALSAMVARSAPPAQLGGAFARFSLASAIGVALTPTLGGWMYEHLAIWTPFLACGLLFLVSALPLLQGLPLAEPVAIE